VKNFEIIQKLKELRDQMSVLKEEEDLLHVQLKNRINEARDLQAKRDDLNAKVKELSSKPREILSERKDIWDDIKVTGAEKGKLIRQIQPYLQRIGEVRKVRDAYNTASRGTMERLIENYKATSDQLLGSDINLKNELYLFELLFSMRDRIYVKRKADKLHREIVRIKEVDLAIYNKAMEDLDIKIDVMKERSHTDLEAAKGLWTERDMIRAEAQGHHKAYLEKNREIKDIKKAIDRKKREKHDLFTIIDSWSSELKKSPEERRQLDNQRRLKDALAKYKQGESLSLEEMGMLLEAGELK
jgi:uncharacterized coiled-coil DUF342 family protein